GPLTDAPPREAFFAMSTDAGRSWQDLDTPPAGDGLPLSLGTDEGQLYIGAGTGLYTGEARLPLQWRPIKGAPRHVFNVFPGKSGPYVTGDGGGFMHLDEATAKWSMMSRQLPDNMVLAVHESRSGKLIVGCDSGIYVSTDKGATWTHTLKTGQIKQFVEDGADILACNWDQLWRSGDDGQTWKPVSFSGASTFFIGQASDKLVAIHAGAEFAGV